MSSMLVKFHYLLKDIKILYTCLLFYIIKRYDDLYLFPSFIEFLEIFPAFWGNKNNIHSREGAVQLFCAITCADTYQL